MATTTRQQITGEDLITLIEECDLTPRSYSGRGMFGERCMGVTLSGSEALGLGARLARYAVEAVDPDDHDDVEAYAQAVTEQLRNVDTLMRGARDDSMGLDVIVYWPNVAWPAGMQESEDDDGRN